MSKPRSNAPSMPGAYRGGLPGAMHATQRNATNATTSHLPAESCGNATPAGGHTDSPRLADRWSIELPHMSPPLSQNKRLHWAVEHRLRGELMDTVGWLAKAQRLPTGLGRVEITLHWQPAIRRRRDTDNPAPTLKACIDALTRYGLTVDDDSEHVRSGVEIHPLASPARLWLTIFDLSGVRPGETP